MTHLNGYYMDGKRLALVRSFNEGLTVLYFDDLRAGVVRQPHVRADMFKPITLDQAIATGLNDAHEYVEQVRRGPLVRRLMDEPKLALLLVDPSTFRPDMTKGSVWLKGVGSLPEPQHADRCRLWFRADFSYFDHNRDEERTYGTDFASICPPRSLVESFTPKAYAKWIKGEVAKKRAALVKHVAGRVAEAKAILS